MTEQEQHDKIKVLLTNLYAENSDLKTQLETLKVSVRNALADYMGAEGCGCCANDEAQDAACQRLAKLLDVPAYSDNSGFDFTKFETPK